MPFLGQGSTVGSRLPDLANFPSDGLAALYKLDERQGSRMKDAGGNWPHITLSTGVMFDAAAGDCYYVDTSGLRDDLEGEVADMFWGYEFQTPAATGAARTLYLMGNGGNSNYDPMQIRCNEITTTNTFQILVQVRTTRDGSTSAYVAFNAPYTLEPSTTYQVVFRMITSESGVKPYAQFSLRKSVDGAWSDHYDAGSGTAGSHILVLHASANVGILKHTNSFLGGWNGKIGFAFLGSGAASVPLSSLKAVMERPGKTNIRNILGTETARFWDFRYGDDDVVVERCTDTVGAMTGTSAWAVDQAGCSQNAIRQGNPYYGRPGLRLGGEAGFMHGGSGIVSTGDTVSIDSLDGWTLQWTGCVGPNLPAANRPILFATATPLTGDITDPEKMGGVGFSLSSAGRIRAHVKGATTADATNNLGATMGDAESVDNGKLGTYTIVCSASGVVTAYKQLIGESTPTAISPPAGWSASDFRRLRTTGLKIGVAASDADITIGFVAAYRRPLTTSEMALCHNMAVSRMKGDTVYTEKTVGLYGNGTENFPFEELRAVWRKMQPGQTVYCGPGTYTSRCVASSSTLSPASQDFTFIGAGSATTKLMAGAGATDYPFSSEGGTQYWSGITFDANDASARAYDGGTTAAANSAPVHSFEDCAFINSKNSSGAGSGMVSRALYVRLHNCEASGNESHGVYLRIASDTEGNHRCVVTDYYAHDNLEDGLKFATDTTSPNMATRCAWSNCIIDRVKVDGGLRQVWLSGVADSVITNLLLLNSTNTGGVPGALRLGHPSGDETDADTEDGCWNNTIANVTIVDAAGIAVHDARSEGTTIQNLICSGCADDLTRGDDGTAEITYSAGDADSNPLPTHATNILDASIIFTNAAGGDYTLTALSDGYAMGVNLTGLSEEAQSDFAGTARPASGAWNMGAY